MGLQFCPGHLLYVLSLFIQQEAKNCLPRLPPPSGVQVYAAQQQWADPVGQEARQIFSPLSVSLSCLVTVTQTKLIQYLPFV